MLGDDIGLGFGIFVGSTETNGVYGWANWRYTVSGDDARGRYEWAAQRDGTGWTVETARLEVDDVVVDVHSCLGRGAADSDPHLVPKTQPELGE